MDAVRRFAVDCGAAPEPPPLGLRVPPRTPHRGRCDDDTSGGDIPAVTIPPTWSAGKTDGPLDASINPTHEKRTKPVPPRLWGGVFLVRSTFTRCRRLYCAEKRSACDEVPFICGSCHISQVREKGDAPGCSLRTRTNNGSIAASGGHRSWPGNVNLTFKT